MAQTVLREIQGLLNYLGGEEKRKRPAGVYPLEPTGTLEAVVSDIGETLSGARWGDEYNPSYDYEESFPIEEEAQAIWNMAIGDPVSRMGEALKSYAAGMPLARDPEMGPPQLTGIGQDVAGTLLEFAPIAGPYKRGAERIASNYMDEFMPAPQYGIMAGRGARDADEGGLLQAMQRTTEGADRKDILKETGWWRGNDGEWRFEIDDSEATLNQELIGKNKVWGDAHFNRSYQEPGKPITVEEVVDHPVLFENYPELRAMPVSVKPGGGASFHEKTPTNPAYIEIGDEVSVDEVKSILLHEIQHGIQRAEGFARGGNTEMFRRQAEAEKWRDIRNWRRELDKKRESMPNADSIAVENALIKDYQGANGMDWLPPREIRDEAAQPYWNDKESVDKIEELIDLYGLNERIVPYTDRQLYDRLAGEVEAVNVQDRLKLPARRRSMIPPWETQKVSDEKQIKIFESGGIDTMESYRGQHSAPVPEGKNSLDNPSDIFPDSVHDPKFKHYYGYGSSHSKADDEALAVMRKVSGNPDAEVTVYRAVPEGVDSINAGDWVTTSREYAVGHGEGPMQGDYHIIEQKVKAGDLHTEGAMHEWGWNPKSVAGAGAGGSGLLANQQVQEDNQKKRKEEPGLLGQF